MTIQELKQFTKGTPVVVTEYKGDGVPRAGYIEQEVWVTREGEAVFTIKDTTRDLFRCYRANQVSNVQATKVGA